jgi:hypothetical protein
MIQGKVIEAEVLPATGFQGEEAPQKSFDPAALVQAEPLEVSAPAAESGLVVALPDAAEIPTGSPENHGAPDEQSGVLAGSYSVDPLIATHLDTPSASSEAVEDGQPATQEASQRVEIVEKTHEATTKPGAIKMARKARTEGGRGSSKSRRVSGGH